MSHMATNWAVEQRGLKPATKVVLWHLADRHNKDFGCFPSQALLADDCEMSRSSINNHLNILEERGLIRRIQVRNERTFQQENTRYLLAFEKGFEPKIRVGENGGNPPNPRPEFGHGNEPDAVSRSEAEPCPDLSDSRVQNLDTNPVREPGREPVNEREGVREGAEGEKTDTVTRETWKRRFKKAHRDWPTYLTDSEVTAEVEWFKLSEEDRLKAAELSSVYVSEGAKLGRKKFCAFAVYLGEKRWERLSPQATKIADGKRETAAPFGKNWGALRLSVLMGEPDGVPPRLTAVEERLCADGKYDRDELMRGKWARCGWPKVNMMQDDAMHRHKGRKVDAVAERLGADFVQVPVGSDGWKAWQELHEERGWPWFEGDLGRVEWVYFPASPDAPDSYASPLEAVRAAMARFETEHAALTQKDAAE